MIIPEFGNPANAPEISKHDFSCDSKGNGKQTLAKTDFNQFYYLKTATESLKPYPGLHLREIFT